MEEEELKELSGQLMNPSGKKGIEIADMMNENNRGMIINSIDNLDLKGGERVLEIGHGNAGHLNYLFSKTEGLKYNGLDISELMIQEASKINHSLIERGNVSFTCYDGQLIPFENDFFDTVFTVNTIYFWKDPAAFLKEIKRVMKTGASFALTFADAEFMEQLPFTKFNFTLYNIDAVVGLVEQSGLMIEKNDIQKETVKSKAGDLVERKFVTMLIRKTVLNHPG